MWLAVTRSRSRSRIGFVFLCNGRSILFDHSYATNSMTIGFGNYHAVARSRVEKKKQKASGPKIDDHPVMDVEMLSLFFAHANMPRGRTANVDVSCSTCSKAIKQRRRTVALATLAKASRLAKT